MKKTYSIPLCILLCIFEAVPFTDTLHVSLHLQTLMQMVQLFINLVLKNSSECFSRRHSLQGPNFIRVNKNFAVEFAREQD